MLFWRRHKGDIVEQNIQGVGDYLFIYFSPTCVQGPITTQKAMFNIQSDMINSCQHGAPRDRVKVMTHLHERWLPVLPLAAESFFAPFYLAPIAHPFLFKELCGSHVWFMRGEGDETFWIASYSTFWSCLTDETLMQLSKVHLPKALQADQSSLWHSANLTQVITALKTHQVTVRGSSLWYKT